MKNEENNLPFSCSLDAAVPCPDAVWILYAGKVCSDGGVLHHGIQVLREQQDDCGGSVWDAGVAVSAYLQDCVGTDSVECGGRVSGSVTHWIVLTGEKT